jgi:hypothetical protein
MSNKTRKRPVYNRLRQYDWIMWRVVSEIKCCFCNELLFEGFDKKRVNVTVHHLKGSMTTDDRSKPAPIAEQLFAHSVCHRGYHHMERMKEKGQNIDSKRFAVMERNVRSAQKRMEKMLSK